MPAIYSISESAGPPAVTIIFIHGSGGHYLKNWGSLQEGSNWISWFGHDLENADVFSVQHEGNFWSLADEGTFDDYAETIGYALTQRVRSERIVFVAYSLGGIIAKRLMKLIADSDSKLATLKMKNFAFCFIATPHLGANFPKLRFIAGRLPNRLLGVIFGWNPEIQKINDDFLQIRPPLVGGIICFGERKRYLGLIRLIDRSSGFIAHERVQNLPISKSHSEICVVTTRGDVVYMSILKLAQGFSPKVYVGEEFFEIDSQILDRIFE